MFPLARPHLSTVARFVALSGHLYQSGRFRDILCPAVYHRRRCPSDESNSSNVATYLGHSLLILTGWLAVTTMMDLPIGWKTGLYLRLNQFLPSS